MNKQIHFTRTTSFLGRNGCFKATGLTIFKLDDVLQIYPVTSKDKLGKCNICIPQSSVPELIDTLKSFLEDGNESKNTDKIAFIKDVIAKWGETSDCELELESSPCLFSMGNGDICELVEDFCSDHVRTTIYIDQTEIEFNHYRYEELPDHIIDEIYEIMKKYNEDPNNEK